MADVHLQKAILWQTPQTIAWGRKHFCLVISCPFPIGFPWAWLNFNLTGCKEKISSSILSTLTFKQCIICDPRDPWQQWQPPVQEWLIAFRENYRAITSHVLWPQSLKSRNIYLHPQRYLTAKELFRWFNTLCTESESQSPTYSTRNLRIRSQIFSLTVSSEASTSTTALTVPAGLPQSRTRCLAPKDAPFHFQP